MVVRTFEKKGEEREREREKEGESITKMSDSDKESESEDEEEKLERERRKVKKRARVIYHEHLFKECPQFDMDDQSYGGGPCDESVARSISRAERWDFDFAHMQYHIEFPYTFQKDTIT
jgi:hypothetical protein